jgi:AcrR family transcriptional regulator
MQREIPPQAVRVLDAALTCIGRVGLAKTTLDDVAREAGCARATVYRYFPGKQQLICALVEREVAAFRQGLLAAAQDAPSLGEAVTTIITTAAGALLGHPALTFVAAHEPEMLLPYLAFERESAVLGAAAQLVAPAFAPFLPIDRATRLAEWVARITLSYLCCPSEHVDVNDALQVRALVDDFVLPATCVPPALSKGVTP